MGQGAGRSRVVVVTDTTAALGAGSTALGSGVPEAWEPPLIVPLHVILGDESYREGIDLSTDELVARIIAGETASTSQPGPEAFAAAYEAAAAAGATEIVSIHISGELSGTVHAAALAAARASVPVTVVDSGTAGAALGFAVRAAQQGAAAGERAASLARTAIAVARSSSTMFLVETLEYLRRGGRLGFAAATVGTVLGVRPILALRDAKIEFSQVARSRRGAEARLVAGVLAHVQGLSRPVVALHYFDDRSAADEMAERLREQLAELEVVLDEEIAVLEVSAVLGVHVGPGLLGAVVADAGAAPDAV